MHNHQNQNTLNIHKTPNSRTLGYKLIQVTQKLVRSIKNHIKEYNKKTKSNFTEWNFQTPKFTTYEPLLLLGLWRIPSNYHM